MLTKKQQSVFKYLKKGNIRTGEFRTPLFWLYYNYTKYCRLADLKRVSPIEFGRRMAVYFEKGKSGRYAYYLTNLEPPNSKKRRKVRLWYNRLWAGMRNGKTKKG